MFAFDVPTEAVFGNIQGVKLGLRCVKDMLTDASNEDNIAMGVYIKGLFKLESQFRKRSDLQDIVATRLGHVNFKAQHFSDDAVELAASISSIYQDTISHLPYRIEVKGSVQHLQETKNADLVRTLLLAGLRSRTYGNSLAVDSGISFFAIGNSSVAESLSQELSPIEGNDSLH